MTEKGKMKEKETITPEKGKGKEKENTMPDKGKVTEKATDTKAKDDIRKGNSSHERHTVSPR